MPGGSQVDANSPFAQALSQIGQDLPNGDINAAQQTLGSLKSQIHHAHHHGRHRPAASDTADASTESDSSQATGSTGSMVNVLA